jgi:osmotically-inducible protein OsmY
MSPCLEKKAMIKAATLIKTGLRPLCSLALAGFVMISLQGCIELAVGSAVVGTLAATDRRTFGAQTEDKSIVLKSEGKINAVVGNNGHVNANSFNRRVLLTGEIKDQALKSAIEKEIAAIEGVQSVVNELVISGSSNLTSRSSDTLITGKVKTALVEAKDIQANTFKVITESGTVYLMGRVSQREGRIAADVASSVNGVRKVVKVLEYISDEEVQQLNKTTPPPPDSGRN